MRYPKKTFCVSVAVRCCLLISFLFAVCMGQDFFEKMPGDVMAPIFRCLKLHDWINFALVNKSINTRSAIEIHKTNDSNTVKPEHSTDFFMRYQFPYTRSSEICPDREHVLSMTMYPKKCKSEVSYKFPHDGDVIYLDSQLHWFCDDTECDIKIPDDYYGTQSFRKCKAVLGTYAETDNNSFYVVGTSDIMQSISGAASNKILFDGINKNGLSALCSSNRYGEKSWVCFVFYNNNVLHKKDIIAQPLEGKVFSIMVHPDENRVVYSMLKGKRESGVERPSVLTIADVDSNDTMHVIASQELGILIQKIAYLGRDWYLSLTAKNKLAYVWFDQEKRIHYKMIPLSMYDEKKGCNVPSNSQIIDFAVDDERRTAYGMRKYATYVTADRKVFVVTLDYLKSSLAIFNRKVKAKGQAKPQRIYYNNGSICLALDSSPGSPSSHAAPKYAYSPYFQFSDNLGILDAQYKNKLKKRLDIKNNSSISIPENKYFETLSVDVIKTLLKHCSFDSWLKFANVNKTLNDLVKQTFNSCGLFAKEVSQSSDEIRQYQLPNHPSWRYDYVLPKTTCPKIFSIDSQDPNSDTVYLDSQLKILNNENNFQDNDFTNSGDFPRYSVTKYEIGLGFDDQDTDRVFYVIGRQIHFTKNFSKKNFLFDGINKKGLAALCLTKIDNSSEMCFLSGDNTAASKKYVIMHLIDSEIFSLMIHYDINRVVYTMYRPYDHYQHKKNYTFRIADIDDAGKMTTIKEGNLGIEIKKIAYLGDDWYLSLTSDQQLAYVWFDEEKKIHSKVINVNKYDEKQDTYVSSSDSHIIDFAVDNNSKDVHDMRNRVVYVTKANDVFVVKLNYLEESLAMFNRTIELQGSAKPQSIYYDNGTINVFLNSSDGQYIQFSDNFNMLYLKHQEQLQKRIDMNKNLYLNAGKAIDEDPIDLLNSTEKDSNEVSTRNDDEIQNSTQVKNHTNPIKRSFLERWKVPLYSVVAFMGGFVAAGFGFFLLKKYQLGYFNVHRGRA